MRKYRHKNKFNTPFIIRIWNISPSSQYCPTVLFTLNDFIFISSLSVLFFCILLPFFLSVCLFACLFFCLLVNMCMSYFYLFRPNAYNECRSGSIRPKMYEHLTSSSSSHFIIFIVIFILIFFFFIIIIFSIINIIFYISS